MSAPTSSPYQTSLTPSTPLTSPDSSDYHGGHPVCVGSYRSNAGDADVVPANRGLARRSDAFFNASLPSSAPLFTGCCGARADARSARLVPTGAPPLPPAVVEASAANSEHGFFGADGGNWERRARKYSDGCDADFTKTGRVFSGADSGVYHTRMMRLMDSR